MSMIRSVQHALDSIHHRSRPHSRIHLVYICARLGHLKINKLVVVFVIPACMASVVMYVWDNLPLGLHHTRLQIAMLPPSSGR